MTTTKTKLKRLTHLVIRVRSAQRSKKFYTEVMGLNISGEFPGMIFYSTDDAQTTHDLATQEIGDDAPGPQQNRVGMYHMAWQVESIEELENFHRKLKEHDVKIVGYGEHGVAFGIYFLDPDDNEIEVTYELPKEQWPDGKPVLRGPIPFTVNLQD
jgi:catechol-2,3-dioxygenase